MVVVLGIYQAAEAFHAGWTGDCDGCHAPSSLADGTRVGLSLTSSEMCLRCHSAAKPVDHQVATNPIPPPGIPPVSLTPGGDFAYLQKMYYWTDQEEGGSVSPGERHGHNIVAPAYGYAVDVTLAFAPGGSYPATGLSCISCHDPHGNYRLVDASGTIVRSGNPISDSGSYGTPPSATEAVGTYRMLAGKGYGTKSVDHTFQYDPPIAVAPRNYNRPEVNVDTRVVYGKGASEWCLNCHDGFASRTRGSGHMHAAGAELGGTIAGNYNRYVKTGDLGGNQSTAFTSLVPFQSGDMTGVQQLAALTTSLEGPRPEDKVTCLTCHRAHASAWNGMTRWNTKGSFLLVNSDYPGIDAPGKGGGRNAGGKTRAEYKKAMYDRDPSRFAAFQRSLCNKCHAKD
ncbi:hypothetical protein KI810_12970 [Geobacter luticola]|uniref:Doubled CXXCH motif domain-containing protein n=2 Tax=Geomobilimonas luticola TaxID=1114878 RepID=A0ABS5SF43_9BACT|nr:hypothetical protein [Geomobilimonas luticola]